MSQAACSLYNVMTTPNKEVLINLRLRPQTREDFRIAAELRGLSMSGLLHQFIIKTIREEKEREPGAFAHQPHIVSHAQQNLDTGTGPAQNDPEEKIIEANLPILGLRYDEPDVLESTKPPRKNTPSQATPRTRGSKRKAG